MNFRILVGKYKKSKKSNTIVIMLAIERYKVKKVKFGTCNFSTFFLLKLSTDKNFRNQQALRRAYRVLKRFKIFPPIYLFIYCFSNQTNYETEFI